MTIELLRVAGAYQNFEVYKKTLIQVYACDPTLLSVYRKKWGEPDAIKIKKRGVSNAKSAKPIWKKLAPIPVRPFVKQTNSS